MPVVNVGGLISGLDTNGIIEAILEVKRVPQLRLQAQVERATQKQTALLQLSAQTLATSTAIGKLGNPSLFNKSIVTSSNPTALSAVADASFSLKGSFSFTPLRLASADQYTSTGFSSASQLLGAGQVSVEVGRGSLARETQLSSLNGNAGVNAGKFRITDKSGKSADIDIQGLVTLNEVIQKINGTAGVDIQASVNAAGNGLDLLDYSGGAGSITVQDLNGGVAASDLGIAGTTTGGTLNGASIVRITGATQLSSLNDGRGVRQGAGDDFTITGSDGTTTVGVDLNGVTTVQGVLDRINAANPNFSAAISADGRGIEITDTLGGGSATTITDGFYSAATDLGIASAVAESAGTGGVVGRDLISGINTVLLSSLNGGSGVAKGLIDITDRQGNSTTVDLTGAQTLQDVINAINANGVAQVQASVGAGGTGLLISDVSGGSGSLIVNNNGGTTATDLGIENGAGTTSSKLFGSNLQLQYITENTTLESLNVAQGKIKIYNKNGQSYNIDLTQANNNTIGSIAEEISVITGGTVNARVNDTGDGLLLEDTTGGSLQLRVEDESGTLARDLKILGSTTETSINGSFETTITIEATDTLQNLVTKLNTANGGFTASLINDGSGANPYRINLISNKTGDSGRLAFDFSQLGVNFNQTAKAQDALLQFGEPGAGTPLLVRSSDNNFEDVLPGLDLTIFQATGTSVTVSAGNNNKDVAAQVKAMVDGINQVLGTIKDLSSFNPDTLESGLLFGDTTVRNHERTIQRALSSRVFDIESTVTSMSQLGVRITETGKYFFDETVFNAKLAEDPDGVKEFFTARETVTKDDGSKEIISKGFAVKLQDYFETFTNSFDGTVKSRTDSIDEQIKDLNDRITRIDESIASEEERLIREFARMETLVNQYQSIGQRLSSLSSNLVQPRNSKK